MVVSLFILFVCCFSVLGSLLVAFIYFFARFFLFLSVYFAPPFVFICVYFGFIVSLFVDFVANSLLTMR